MKKFKYSINRKVFFMFLFLVIGIIVTSSIATITGANSLIRDTTIDYTYQLLGEVESSIAEYEKSMRDIGGAISNNEIIKDYIYEDVINEDESVKVLDFAATTRTDITNIFVMKVEENNDLTILVNDNNSKINEFAKYRRTSWYNELIIEGKSSSLTSSYVQNLVEDQYNWVVSLAIAMPDDHGQIKGIILIDLNYSTMAKILNNVMPEEQGYIYLLSDDEEIVYHPSQQLIFNNVEQEDISVIKNIHNSHVQIDDNVYVVIDSGISKWKTVAVLDSTVVYRNILVNTIIFVGIAIIFVILSLFISLAFSRWFTKPIRNLSTQMKKVQDGDLSVRVSVNSVDEIGDLSDSFNVMTERIESLLDKIVVEQEEKRNYELNALRSQINPHFLYNTLDSIIWMAECDQNEQVVEMTSALSKMLRASINNQKAGVTLGLEVQNVVNYLKIQKFRYKNKLDYEVDIDLKLYTRNAAHLVLQPLVENAIYHGTKSKEGPGLIQIKAYEKGKFLFIEVTDNGLGMSESKIHSVLNQDRDNHNGIGITNVMRRIKLMYGDEYGLSIHSEVLKGTTIILKLPNKDLVSEGDDLYDNKYS